MRSMPCTGDRGVDDAPGQLGAGGVARQRRGDRHHDPAAVDGHTLHHAQVDDRAVQVGVFDPLQGRPYIGLQGWHQRLQTSISGGGRRASSGSGYFHYVRR